MYKLCCSLMVCSLLLLSVPGMAQESAADGKNESTGYSAADSTGRQIPLAQEKAWIPVVIEPPADPGYFDTPTWALMRSFSVPGWGQIHNRAWIKALGVIAIEGAMIERLLFERDRVHYYRDLKLKRPEEADYYQIKEDRHKSHRRDFVWWTSLFVFLSMWDAYVDAHLRYFDVELQTSPELFQEPTESDDMELSLRFSFGIGK